MAQNAPKTRVAVLFGGRSSEHEISLISARSVIQNLDRSRFEVVPIGIDRDGRWYLNDISLLEKVKGPGGTTLDLPVRFSGSAPEVTVPLHQAQTSGGHELWSAGQGKGGSLPKFDVAFPVMHGTLCEDGAIQGLLELAGIPYVGCGVLGSAIGMDKEVAKRLANGVGIPVVPFVSIRKDAFVRSSADVEKRVWDSLELPVFVKPACLGSSVGVHKVKQKKDLKAALEDVFRYDLKALVERAVPAREIEVAVLENLNSTEPPIVSVPGEIVPKHEFYSYEAKYLDENGAELKLPAEITEAQAARARTLAREIFLALECEGMARVDLFLDKDSGEFYFNELNTIPGFTQISMYPKMMEASGVSYKNLLTHLIELALKRKATQDRLVRDWKS